MTYKTIATRVPKEIDEFLKKIMKEERLDKSATTRRILEMGITEWRKEKAINALKKRKATLAKSAEIAGLTIYEMIEVVKEKKIDYIHITQKDIEEEAALAESD